MTLDINNIDDDNTTTNKWINYNIIICFSTFFHLYLKVKDSWDVDSDEENEDSSNEKGVYVKKKTLFFSFVDCMDIVQSYSCCTLFLFHIMAAMLVPINKGKAPMLFPS